jgi:hypothetical protein
MCSHWLRRQRARSTTGLHQRVRLLLRLTLCPSCTAQVGDDMYRTRPLVYLSLIAATGYVFFRLHQMLVYRLVDAKILCLKGRSKENKIVQVFEINTGAIFHSSYYCSLSQHPADKITAASRAAAASSKPASATSGDGTVLEADAILVEDARVAVGSSELHASYVSKSHTCVGCRSPWRGLSGGGRAELSALSHVAVCPHRRLNGLVQGKSPNDVIISCFNLSYCPCCSTRTSAAS